MLLNQNSNNPSSIARVIVGDLYHLRVALILIVLRKSGTINNTDHIVNMLLQAINTIHNSTCNLIDVLHRAINSIHIQICPVVIMVYSNISIGHPNERSGPIKSSIDNVGNISIGSKRIQQSRAACKSHQSIADLKVLIILCDAVQQRSQLAIRFKAEQVSLLREQLIIQSIRNCAGSGVVINRGNDGSGGRAVVTTSGQHADSHDASEHQRSNFLEFHNDFFLLMVYKR